MENTVCPVCGKEIVTPSTRTDAMGRRWCLKCEEEFDNIDWEKVRNE